MFYDVETNGLPDKKKAKYAGPQDVEVWPRVIQLAWRLCDEAGQALSEGNHLIKPDGWEIPADKFWIEHGFSTELSDANGVPLSSALTPFIMDMQQARYLVSHNQAFDYNVVGAECVRLNFRSAHRPARICTKEASTEFCALPFESQSRYRGGTAWGKREYKWPRLDQLHAKLFGRDFENAHDALGDVSALQVCFFELLRIGIIKLPHP